MFSACHKAVEVDPVNITHTDSLIVHGTDPDPVTAQGFFLDSWKPKKLIVPAFTDVPKLPEEDADVTVSIDPTAIITKVSPYMYGNNINTYMTQVVTEPVLLKHIVNLSPGVLRAPGGSLSDQFFWNALKDKLPADIPDKIIDATGAIVDTTRYWVGMNNESWTLSIDNYYKVLQSTGSAGIAVINYGYARYGTGKNPVQTAAHLAADWVRYDKGHIKYWEIGNENYGIWEPGYRIDKTKNKDGQPEFLNGTLYGKHFKIFADSMRKAAAEVHTTIKIGAVMTPNANLDGVIIPNWNADVIAASDGAADFYALHSYYTRYNEDSDIKTIMATADHVTNDMMSYISRSMAQAPRPVALTEWNIQATGSKQQVSNIAGLHAAMTLGELIQAKFGQAIRWDLANSWQKGDDMGMFNVGDEPDGAVKWQPRPAFYYMYYFQKFFGDRMVSSKVTGSNAIVSYASTFSNGPAGTALINRSANSHTVTVNISNFKYGVRYYYYTITGGTDATFSRKCFVNGIGPTGVSGGPSNYSTIFPYSANPAKGIKLTIPAYSAVYLTVEGK